MTGWRIGFCVAASLALGWWAVPVAAARGIQAQETPTAATQEPDRERERLAQQADQLRDVGKIDAALPLAVRALELERKAESAKSIALATPLERVAILEELEGDFAAAVTHREESLQLRQTQDGADHWRTFDARRALEFDRVIAGEGEPVRNRVRGALRTEREAARLDAQGKPDDAEKAALAVIDVFRDVPGPESVESARLWHLLGRVRLGRGDLDGAKSANQQALAIRRKVLPSGHPDTGKSQNNLGLVLLRTGDPKAAKGLLEEAVRNWKDSLDANDPLSAMGLMNLGAVQRDLRDFAAASKTYADALAIRRRILHEDDPRIADSLNNLGVVQSKLRDFAAARKSFDEALAIRRKALPADHPRIAGCLNNLGALQYDLGDFAAARQSDEEALAILRKALPADHPDLAASLNNLGNVQWKLRDFAAARKSHEKALAIRRKALPADHPDIAHSLNHLGNVQWDLHEFAAARLSREEALAIFRRALPADHPDIAQSLSNLGTVQQDLQDFAAALKSHEEALAIFRRALPADDPKIATSLNNLGNVQWDLHEFAAARKSHAEALAIRRKALPADHPNIAHSLNNLGVVQDELRDFAAARKSHEEALAIFRKALPADHPDIASSLENLANLELESGSDAARVVPSWLEASDIRQENQLRLAIAQAEQEQMASAVQVHSTVGLLVGAVVRSGGDPAAAYDRVVRAKGSVTAQQRWARRLRDGADPETRRLLDHLRLVNQQLVGLSMPDRPGRTGSETPADLPTQIHELSAERTRLERELSERSPLYESFRARARIGTAQIQVALPAGTALVDLVEYKHVEPAAGEQERPSYQSRLAAFVVRPDRPEVALVPLGSSNELAELIKAWRARYGAGGKPADKSIDPPAELRKRLWEPLAAQLEGVKVVLISPDGPVTGLPWAALPGSRPNTYLVHEYAFAILPVPQLLPELVQGKPRLAEEAPSLLLAGGIDFGSGPPREAREGGEKPPLPLFSPLSGTESEVNDLRSQYEDAFPDAPAPKRLARDRATKQAVLAVLPSSRFVHLATHGFFAESPEPTVTELAQRAESLRGGMNLRSEATVRNPGLLSGLVFAGVNRADRPPEETILTALEAAEQELGQVELVVLSACETGLGRLAGGEGVLGLQRAFQVAGARSIVASLWRVPDEETHQLMREFYRRVWSADAPSKAEALRQAQLWMIANAKPGRGFERQAPTGPLSPFFWAAFVLSGDWR